MFETYTEKARRVIFFARYEASQFGSPNIESEHLLLRLLREDKALTNRFLRAHAVVESIRKQIEAHTTVREKVSTSVDLPLSNESTRVLAYAAEEAERLGHKHIGTEHLLLGLLREEECFAAAILKERGLKLESIREELARVTHKPETGSAAGAAPLSAVLWDLTHEAMDGELDPVAGRDREIDALIEILCCRVNKNPVLIGEHGVGRADIVAGLAQRIADGMVPAFLAEKRILVFDPQDVPGWIRSRQTVAEGAIPAGKLSAEIRQMLRRKIEEQQDSAVKAPADEEEASPSGRLPAEIRQMLRQKIEERLYPTVKTPADSSEVILFFDELQTLLAANPSRSPNAAEVLRLRMAHGEFHCIAACTPNEYRTLVEEVPWFGDCFRAVHVNALDEEETLRVLKARKDRYEKFHGVSYTDEALECAARCGDRFLPEVPLPGKALELLDAAGARVKLRQVALPEEIVEVQKKIKFIVHRKDSAIASHEFEKARFYFDEERKERENLRALREKHHLDDSASGVVGREDVEEVIKRWAEYPFRP